jgi:hydrogenase maturation protease
VNVHRSMLFVGVGSPHGDDQIGWHVADALAKIECLSERVTIRKAIIPLDLVDWLEGGEFLGVCDAAESSSTVGTLLRWEWDNGQKHSLSKRLPALVKLRSQGTHDFHLPNVLELAARLNRLPSRIVVWTVSAKHFEPNATLSEMLRTRVDSFCNQIATELGYA